MLGAAQTQTSYLIIPGASGFKTDAYTGSIDLYQMGFQAPVYKENRGHVGTWLTKCPDAFYAMGAEKVLPKFIYNETLVEAQEEFEAGSEERPDLYVPTDYAFYNSQTNKARRLEMVFDAIMNTEKPLLVLGTSEGGAIIQKMLESEELVAHMTKFSHRIAIISPAYAVGDESIVDDPFYSRAKLNPDCWYICSQATTYQQSIPIHVINTDIGFAGVQGMASDTNGVDLSVYNTLLTASVDEPTSSFLTWDYYPGAPHSFPACNIVRTEDVDAGVKNGVDTQRGYEGSLNDKATNDLVALFREMESGLDWSSSTREWWSKSAFKDAAGYYHPTIDETFEKARMDEVFTARSSGFEGEDEDVIIAYRRKVWAETDTAACVAQVEEERAASRPVALQRD